MKWKLEKKYILTGMTAFGVIAAGILFYFLVSHLGSIAHGIRALLKILAPILYAAIIAYLLNPILEFLEVKCVHNFCKKQKIRLNEKAGKIIRAVCVILSIVFFYACIYGLFALLVPQLINSIVSLVNSFPRYSRSVMAWINQLLENHPEWETSATDTVASITNSLETWLNDSLLPQLNTYMKSFSSQLVDMFNFIKNVVLGSMISFYFLYSKEHFIAYCKRALYALVPRAELANNILRDARFVESTFGGFFLGKIIDSAIICVICYIGTLILSMPYALLVSVIIGVTNIIPFFGPIIGAVPCILLILLVSPIKAFYFLIFILILQQFDGNFLGPKILGNSTGLSSFMVVVAILVGSGLFGVVGMIIGVPLFAVITQLVKNIEERLLHAHQMPQDLDAYKNLDHMDEETGKPVHKRKKDMTIDRSEAFKYGVRGKRLSDQDTDDEILPVYIIHKSGKKPASARDVDASALTESDFEEVYKPEEYEKLEELKTEEEYEDITEEDEE